MKLWSTAKPVMIVSIVLALALAGNPEVRASGTIAKFKDVVVRSPLGAKAFNKAATWGAIALFSTSAFAGNVLAKNSDVLHPAEQVIQAQSPKATEEHFSSRIPLYEAVKKLDYEQLEELLETGEVDVNARDEDGNTVLHIITKEHPHNFRGNNSLLNLVLAHGADPTIRNDAGKTPLSYIEEEAEAVGEPEYAIVLAHWVKATYGINGKDGNGLTPLAHALSWAAYLRDIELARQLVAEGADVRITDYFGSLDIYNALDAAAVLVMDRDAFLLLAAEQEGGIADVVKGRGEHLLRMAAEWGNGVVVDVLLDHGVDPSVGMFDAAYVHGDGGTVIVSDNDPNDEILSTLISRGADVNVRHEHGHAPLNVAAEGGKPRTVEILLTHGADPNVPDRWGMTPLHRAAIRSVWYSFEMVSMLLAQGAEANVKDDEGKTPYDNALRRYRNAHTGSKPLAAATNALLLQAMVGVEGKDAQSRTPTYWAELSDNETIQKIIAGEIEITQLFAQETRQRVKQELIAAGEKLEKAERGRRR